MTRRQLLSSAGGAAGILVVGGFGYQAYAQSSFRRRLVGDSLESLLRCQSAELRDIPAHAREELRTWFHGPCLNAAEFCLEICSPAFGQKLNVLPNVSDREELLAQTFFRSVITEGEIQNKLSTTAHELELLTAPNWAQACDEISMKWSRHSTVARPFEGLRLRVSLDSKIGEELRAIAGQASNRDWFPCLMNESAGVVKRAVLLLAFRRVATRAWPVFVLDVVARLLNLVIRFFANPARQMQAEVSARVAVLGNDLADEFASSVTKQLGFLHGLREQAVAEMATKIARERYSLV